MYVFKCISFFLEKVLWDLNKISLNRGGPYIDSPEWLKNKTATINQKNNDDNCFQYALINALNYENIRKNPHRISKIKPFINQCNLKGVNFSSHKEDWKKFESNNKSIAVNILFVPEKMKKYWRNNTCIQVKT